jgi:hypothetical protein
MLKVLATIAVLLWIVVGMAELVSLAPPPVNTLPVNNTKIFDNCAGNQTGHSSLMRLAACEVFRNFHRYREDINAFSTFLIMLLTIALSIFNANLVRSTKMAATATERAAVAAEKGLTELERPWIFLEGATVTRSPWQPASAPNYWDISLRFKNIGRMPAIIDSSHFEIKPKAELPKKPSFSRIHTLSSPQTIASGDSFDTQRVGPAAHENIFLVFYGKVIYTELNGRSHETGFALEVSPNVAAYNVLNSKAYDYFT